MCHVLFFFSCVVENRTKLNETKTKHQKIGTNKRNFRELSCRTVIRVGHLFFFTSIDLCSAVLYPVSANFTESFFLVSAK